MHLARTWLVLWICGGVSLTFPYWMDRSFPVPEARRKAVLPLINKRWARVLRGSSPAWRVVSLGSLDWNDAEEAQLARQQDMDKPLNDKTVLPWFLGRPRWATLRALIDGHVFMRATRPCPISISPM